MGSGMSAMYDDHDRYEELCKRHGVTVLFTPNQCYAQHEQWIKDFFVTQNTRESWSQRKVRLDRERELKEIASLESQLAERKARFLNGT